MSHNPIRAISLDAFAHLIDEMDVGLEPEDISRLIEHDVLVPLAGDGDQHLCPLHLFCVARYIEQVRALYHPWTAASAAVDLADLIDLGAEVTTLADRLRGQADPPPASTETERLLERIEETLEATNPIGRLGEVFDLLRAEVLRSLRGDVRLWAELRVVATGLSALASHRLDADATPVAASREALGERLGSLRTTQSMSQAASADEPAGQTSAPKRQTMEMDAASRKALDHASGGDSPRVTAEIDAVERDAAARAAAQEELVEGEVPTADEADTTAEVSEREDNPFQRDASHKISDSDALRKRLEALRNLDGRRKQHTAQRAAPAATSATPDDDAEDAPEASDAPASDGEEEADTPLSEKTSHQRPSLAPPPSTPREEEAPGTGEHEDLAGKIRELNQQREVFMREQNWSGLVELYEDGIELFRGPERQQVHLTLAKLYEAKLQQTDKALENLEYALEMGGEDAILDKVLGMVGRLARQDGAWATWLEEHVGGDSFEDEAVAALVQRAWTEHLVERGDGARAFLTFASYVLADPAQRVDIEALERLGELTPHVPLAERLAIYDDLLEQLTDEAMCVRIARTAGMDALEEGENTAAARYLEQVFAHVPGDTQIYHILSQLYEEEEEWPALVQLLEARLTADTGGAAGVAEALRQAKERELEHADESLAYYEDALKHDPDDEALLERIMAIYTHEQRFAEGYAFLNQHVGRLQISARKVQVRRTLAQWAAQHLQAPEEAVLHCEEAIDVAEDVRSLTESLARFAQQAQMWPKVLSAVEALAGEDAEDPANGERTGWWWMAARAARQLERPEDERVYLERILASDPGHREAQEALARLQ